MICILFSDSVAAAASVERRGIGNGEGEFDFEAPPPGLKSTFSRSAIRTLAECRGRKSSNFQSQFQIGEFPFAFCRMGGGEALAQKGKGKEVGSAKKKLDSTMKSFFPDRVWQSSLSFVRGNHLRAASAKV